MSIVIVTLLSLAILVVGFLVGWLVGGIGTGLTSIAFLALPVLVIGFLIGWLVEWIIDNQYRRMRELGQSGPVYVPGPASDSDLNELARTVKEVIAEREQEVDELQTKLETQEMNYDHLQAEFDRYAATHPDDLTVIKGIGRIYQWKLRDAGISTYSQLASTSSERVREVLQAQNWQKLDPQGWIDQAKSLTRQE